MHLFQMERCQGCQAGQSKGVGCKLQMESFQVELLQSTQACSTATHKGISCGMAVVKCKWRFEAAYRPLRWQPRGQVWLTLTVAQCYLTHQAVQMPGQANRL